MIRLALPLLLIALGGLPACSSDGSPADDTAASEDTGSDAGDATRTCQGTSKQCSDRFGQTQCEAGDGCSYDVPFCAGTAKACDGLGATACAAQPGCAVDGAACAGAAAPCADRLDQTGCGEVQGCAWTAAFCKGVPKLCGEYADRDSCGPVPGCTWL